VLEIKLDGFNGKPGSLVSWEYTATGVRFVFVGPLADAINLHIKPE
jgi:hypothetical protein